NFRGRKWLRLPSRSVLVRGGGAGGTFVPIRHWAGMKDNLDLAALLAELQECEIRCSLDTARPGYVSAIVCAYAGPTHLSKLFDADQVADGTLTRWLLDAARRQAPQHVDKLGKRHAP